MRREQDPPPRLNADVFELGEHFAGPPSTFHLLLPGKLRMKLVVAKVARAKRKKSTVLVTLQLTRPLNEESCYLSVATMDKQDYANVQAQLEAHFKPKGLTVGQLKLKLLKKVSPRGEFAEPYDLVEATFVVE